MNEIEVGRELDAEVAEKLFGAEWEHFPKADAGVASRLIAPAPDDWILVWHYHDDRPSHFNTNRDCLPEYGTRIEDAWKVVEKMREQGFEMDMGFSTSSGWWALFYDHDENLAYRAEAENYADAETAPLAICCAALLSVPG